MLSVDQEGLDLAQSRTVQFSALCSVPTRLGTTHSQRAVLSIASVSTVLWLCSTRHLSLPTMYSVHRAGTPDPKSWST